MRADDYSEGFNVSNRWFAREGMWPMWPLGPELGYASFAFRDVQVCGEDMVTGASAAAITGAAAADVVQLHLEEKPGRARVKRLIGFEGVMTQPGERVGWN